MELNEYQRLAIRTMRSDLNEEEKLLNCALGLGESGEVQNLVKKLIFHKHTKEECYPKIMDELGDIMWYVANSAETLGVSLSDIAELNINKLMARYPDGFEDWRSRNR